MTDNCNPGVPRSPWRSIRLGDGIKKISVFDDNSMAEIVLLCWMNFTEMQVRLQDRPLNLNG
jgi:hypothetical protein